MPDATRRSRPLARTRDVYTEADGLFGRLADLVIENPARSGGLVMVIMVAGAIVTNAAFFQTARHPDPFFETRTVTETTEAASAKIRQIPMSATVLSPSPAPAAAPSSAAPAPRSADLAPSTAPARKSSAGDDLPPIPVAAPAPAKTGLVADTQRALAAGKIYDGPVDGMMGPQTKSAISLFEMKIGLIPTGQPSARLLQQMRKAFPAAKPIDPPSTGAIDNGPNATLKRVQEALNEIGYGPIPEDGRDGSKTAGAIRRFEADNKLAPSGKAGDAVVAKLVLIGAMKSP